MEWIIAIGVVAAAMGTFIYLSERAYDLKGEKKEQRAHSLKQEASNMESEFYANSEIENQYGCLLGMANIARSPDFIYARDLWIKVEACCRLLKRNCVAGTHDEYWVKCDELQKDAQAHIRD